MYQRVLAGEIPASAVKLKGSSSSNPVTPVGSPVRPAISVPTAVSVPAGQKVGERTTQQFQQLPSQPPAKSGEYNDLLASVLQLRHGNLAPFASLMSQRSDIINSQETLAKEIVNKNVFSESNKGPNRSIRNLKFKTDAQIVDNTGLVTGEESVKASREFPIVPNNDPSVPISSANSVNVGGIVSSTSAGSNANNANSVAKSKQKKIAIINQDQSSNDDGSGDDSTLFELVTKKNRKRKSGIMTKPDESDIKQTVRFPHELLDERHVKCSDKVFNKLKFNQLCVGELELICRPGIKEPERSARVDILMTLCYHAEYLEISEMKSQYAATMNRVERGISEWGPQLASKLHDDLAFRASVLGCEKDKSGKPVKAPVSGGGDQTQPQSKW